MVEKKTVLEKEIKCPYCSKIIDVKHIKKILSETVKGEFEHVIEVSKSSQKRLTT